MVGEKSEEIFRHFGKFHGMYALGVVTLGLNSRYIRLRGKEREGHGTAF
jgi:hypothetical protein